MKKGRKILTRNYLDFKSKKIWLVRDLNETVDEAKAYKAILAHHVEFRPATKIERSRGCAIVGCCVAAEPSLPSAPHEGFQEIGFTGYSFYNRSTAKDVVADKVRAVRTLYLNEKGERWAILYNLQESKNKRDLFLSLFLLTSFFWGAVITYLALSWQDIDQLHQLLWSILLIILSVLQYVFFENQNNFRKRYC